MKNVELDQLKNESTRDSSRIKLIPSNWNPIKKVGKKTKISEKDKNPRKGYQKLFSVNSTATRSPVNNRNIDNNSVNNIIIKSVSEYSINDSNDTTQDLDSELKKMTNIDKIANFLRQKYKRNVRILETLNNQEKGITIERSKRSLDKKSDYVNLEQTASSNKFYRHPNLSYEEQKQFDDQFHAKDTNLNLGGVMNKQVLSAMNSSRPMLRTELSSKESKRHTYVPVFPACNNTDNSEVDDLNRSPPKHLKNLDESKEDDNKDAEWFQKSGDSKHRENLLQENSKSAADQVPSTTESQILSFDQDRTSVPKSLKGRADKTYINIQDHQRNIEETTSSDIPAYDPEKIPYVDVPDYTDIREESLDDDDRRADKKDVKQEDVDSVDPGISTNHSEPFDSTEVGGFEGNRGKVASEKSKKNSERGKTARNENFKKHESDGTLKRDENRGSEGGSGEIQQQNSTAQLEPIIFDINEYRKPFNLDEFLKDDPIMKKLELLGKETRAMYGKNRKQVPSSFNEPESDNKSKERAEEREDSVEDQDGFEFLSNSRRSSDFVDIFANIDRKNMVRKKEGNNTNKKTEDGDSFFNKNDSNEDFLNVMLRKDKKESSFPELKNGEDFRTEYFTDDVIKSQQEDADAKGHRKRKDHRGKGDIHNALFPILKNRLSRLNEHIDKTINARNNSALVYKNFWSPGYNSPSKKTDMVAQEKRK